VPSPHRSDLLVRLANRLKALTVTGYSSDEDEDDSSTAHGSEHSPKKTHSTNGMAFAEVVRATMRAKEESAAAAESKTA
jgi:hypothetical protein